MEMRRRSTTYDEMGEIKKGPWKTEEDEVLIRHVDRYGPRDWSSIRSRGLLHRTGKSCRLRWVNKLRPNLKNGVKFSADEERTVIELQGQFGNKWARIATFLPGRTDNDVKNFWSSRQKRLARVLLSPPPPPPPPPPQKSHNKAPKRSSSGESSVTSPKTLSCSSSYCEPIKMMPLPLPELMNPAPATVEAAATGLVSQDHNPPLCPFVDYTAIPLEENSCNQPPLLQDFNHNIPPPPPPFDTNDIFNQLGDPNFFAVFGQGGSSDIVEFPYVTPGGEGESGSCGREEMMEPDTFMDDFPMDMFDQIEPLPSPSEW